MTDLRHARSRSRPSAAYDPRLIGILRKAAASPPLLIDTGTPYQIRQLQRELWSLLTALERENHPEYATFRQLKLALRTNHGELEAQHEECRTCAANNRWIHKIGHGASLVRL